MKLVTKDSARRAVCLTVNRKNEFEEIQNNKSPVKINDYTISKRFGSDDMLIDKHSKIEVLKNASFEPVHTDISGVVKIAELDNILKDEMVTVKAKLVFISGVKKVLCWEEACNKKEGMIVDPYGNIQIVLWGGMCEKDLTVGETYIFKNFRYRVTNYGRYSNSPKNLECNVEESKIK